MAVKRKSVVLITTCLLFLLLDKSSQIQIDRSYYVGKHGYNSLIDINKFFPKKAVITRRWNDSLESILDYIETGKGDKIPEKVEEKQLKSENSNNTLKEDQDVSSGRFLGIFEVVNFNNVGCISNGGVKGLCLHSLECSTAGGLDSGTCAAGFGVCCIFQYSCGDQSSSNCTTFTNPGYPSPSSDRSACTFTINKASQDIVQLRIEFIQLELLPPTNGTCVDDQFVVSGQNMNNVIPIICGINTGQHVLVEVGDVLGPIYLSVLSGGSESRLFHMSVCQISTRDRVSPQGCLQYWDQPQGIIETFNYQPYSTLPITRRPGYFNNLNYAICIERAPNTCSITYSNAEDSIFQILNYDQDGIGVIPPEQAGAEIFNCPDDFIMVNGIRLCGERLNDASITDDFTLHAPVTELNAGPIVFVFRTNGNVTGRGFRLNYKQNPCILPNY